MIPEFGPHVVGSPSTTPRHIANNCTLRPAFSKGGRDGDNPATATAAAFSHTRGTVHCPSTIFEVQNPSTVPSVEGPCMDRQCPRVAANFPRAGEQNPKCGEGSVRE